MTGHGVRTATRRALVAVLVTVLALVGLGDAALAAPPAVPVLLGPADGAGVSIPFPISWSPVSGAGGYDWEISGSSGFVPVLERNAVLLSGAATTDDVVSGLPTGTYFWRVRAVSSGLEPGAWSAARRVVVTGAGPGVPGSPTLDPPRDATRFHPFETITLSWSAVAGAVSYVLQESTDPSFPVDTRVRQVGILGTTERISLGSANQGAFQARVLAVDADGLMSAPSNLVGFSVSDTNPLPAPPTLLGPANGTTSRLPSTLSWSHVPNHQDDGYQVQISGSSSFATVERTFRSSENRLVVPTLTGGGKFWRVRSQHGYAGATEAYTAWSATGTFTVSAQPLAMSAVTFPAEKFSGGEARGTIDLTGLAPAGGVTVTFTTSHPALLPELPASRQIAAGTSSSQVLVAPTGATNSLRGMRVGFVTTPTPVTVTATATYNGTSASTTITLLPPRLNDTPLQLSPVKLTGGADTTGIVDLEVGCFAGFCDGLAPPGGFAVSVSSSSPAAVVPATFTIPAGAGGAGFPIRTTPVDRLTQVTIAARAGGVTASWTLTLTPAPQPDSLTLVPVSTTDGSQGQVTIATSEMAGYDQRVQVTSSNPAVAAVPAFATVNASTQLGRFDITTSAVDAPTAVMISVTGDGVTRSATLTVSPDLPALTGLGLNPSSVAGGTPSTGTVTLGGPTPSGGVTVSLGSRLPGSASVPATVTVPAGATSATFPITTFPVDETTVELSATLGTTSRFAALSITRSSSAALSALSLNPATVVGGSSSTGTVTLSAAAPSGGTLVALSDDSAAAGVPAGVTVAAGATRRTFTVTTSTVSSSTPVVVTATAAGVTRTATVTVLPPPSGTLPAPSLSTPAVDARFDVGQNVVFDWSDVAGAAGYTIAIDDQSSFSSPTVLRTTTTSTFSTSTLPVARMWYRVRAVDASGTAGTWSGSRRFEVR